MQIISVSGRDGFATEKTTAGMDQMKYVVSFFHYLVNLFIMSQVFSICHNFCQYFENITDCVFNMS